MSKISEVYGELTFNETVMQHKLSKDVFENFIATVKKGEPLDQSIAGDVAHAMKEWAIENGATHFTHWFQPLRGGTAEKHDSFIAYTSDGNLIERFSASQLIQSEPDASSFPSGGMRATFEARGYTAWDPHTPAYLSEAGSTRTLVIPSVFLSWTGEVLDKKTPLLRSQEALSRSTLKLQRILGNRKARKITIFAGPEQEYFLISKELYEKRPDLQVCGRTLFGAVPAKGQQMEDHYFGAIKDKVINFMEDLDRELYRRGIPSKTRHNEVAPNQFEVAVMYGKLSLSVDQNLQLMDILKKTAEKHGMIALLHEKPYAGVNGSGKHLNWSLGDNTGANYLEPSKSPLKNTSFLLTLGAMLKGIMDYGYLVRTAVADAGNDHRLGANEAPPAIMSIYLGEYLAELLDGIEGAKKLDAKKVASVSLGVQNLPRIAKDYSDRNRTSPIAFTGNKFEFRAVGSTHNVAVPAMVINTIMAYGYDYISGKLAKMKGEVKANALTVLKDIIKETKKIRYEGDGYIQEWHKEAAKRGLRAAKNTPAALEAIIEKESIALFEKYKVLSKRELHSKYEIRLEEYIKVKDIEYKVALDIAKTMVLPAVLEQYETIADTANKTKAVGFNSKVIIDELKAIDKIYADIKAGINELEACLTKCEAEKDLLKQAHKYADVGSVKLDNLKRAVDTAERVIADELWPLAKYQDLLLKL
ncbi:glutamine synthetase III [Candidatus Margulisiibacteriota bacterium]